MGMNHDGCTLQPGWMLSHCNIPSVFILEMGWDYIPDDDSTISERFETWQILRILTYREEQP